MKQFICFDLDGTIVSSDLANTKAYLHAFKLYSLPLPNQKKLISLYGRPHEEVVSQFVHKDTPKKIVNSIVSAHEHFLIKESYKSIMLIPHVFVILKKLKKDYLMGIVSNSSHASIEKSLKKTGIPLSWFSVIIGADEVKRAKPYPDGLVKAEKILKQKPIAMIGDSIYDIMAARNAHIPGIGVLTGNYTRKELSLNKPAYIIKSLAYLPKILNKLR
ncbi:MAG: HAD-IA family hydrolase [Nanoarchaeota archaeon]